MKKPLPLLKKASGELTIIVLGVLVALWVDQWRESVSEQEISEQYLAQVAAELQENLDLLERSVRWARNNRRATEAILPHFEAETLPESGILEFLVDVFQPTRYMSASLVTTSFDDLKASGRMQYLPSENLRSELLSYFADAHGPSLPTSLLPEGFRQKVREGLPPDVQLELRRQCPLAPVEPGPCDIDLELTPRTRILLREIVQDPETVGYLRSLTAQYGLTVLDLEYQVRQAEQMLDRLRTELADRS